MSESKPLRSLGAVMSAETEFEDNLDKAPLRVTGFISVLCAVLGGFCLVAIQMIAFVIAAIFFGLLALRKSDSQLKPVGSGAAKFGILLAIFFGACGLGLIYFQQQTLGRQADYFAREYIKLALQGNAPYAGELHKDYRRRFVLSMPIELSYEREKAKREQQRIEAGGETEETELPGESSIEILSNVSPDAEWVAHRPVRLFHRYGHHLAEVYLTAEQKNGKPIKIVISMEYMIHKDRGSIEWMVDSLGHHRSQIVAESIL